MIEESRYYQQALEALRTDPDDEFLQEEFVRARASLESAWITHKTDLILRDIYARV